MPDVLWLEEEPESVEWERIYASNHGWSIVPVETVAEAQELLEQRRFDLVAADLILPLNRRMLELGLVSADAGLQFVEFVRDPNRTGLTPPTVELVVVTAIVSPDRRLRVVTSLRTDRYYLTKPVPEEYYREVVRQINASFTQAA